MESADLNALVDSSLTQSREMADRAAQATSSLTAFEQTLQQCVQSLDQEGSACEQRLRALMTELDQLEAQLQQRAADYHQLQNSLGSQSQEISAQLQSRAADIVEQGQRLRDDSDQLLALIQQKANHCTQEVQKLESFCQSSLQQLRDEQNKLVAQLGALSKLASDSSQQLQGALKLVEQDQTTLESVVTRTLKELVDTYNSTAERTEHQVTDLEQQMQKLTQSTDQQLQQHLVESLGKGVRKTADQFATEMAGLEKLLSQTHENLSQAHSGVRNNMQTLLMPAIQKISSGLHEVAASSGWV